MTQDQLRLALAELNGERNTKIHFVYNHEVLQVNKAMLIPEEPDQVVKLTDGLKIYLLDAERVLWVEIG